ncbi:MAG: SPOR domain-containing protein [Phycisphaeraceae bacterium]|nr:SPOR domain-containing protein [Phycisphaeraceae bacterium]
MQRPRWALGLTLGCVVALGACGPPKRRTDPAPTTPPGLISEAGPGSAMDRVIRAYDSGRFADAYAAALRIVRQSSGRRQEEARYMAGLSAYRLGRDAEAIRYLRPLIQHPNQRISGTSNVTLGLIHQKQGHHESARARFADAAKRLQGEDAARAHYHLGLSLENLGRRNSAIIHYRQALQLSGLESFRQKVRGRLGGGAEKGAPTGAYTLQFGAFSTYARADAHRNQIRARVQKNIRGSLRIVPRTLATGKTLYLVQAGSFADRAAAQSARRRIGVKDSAVVPNRP